VRLKETEGADEVAIVAQPRAKNGNGRQEGSKDVVKG
jgi:hypothetical protein